MRLNTIIGTIILCLTVFFSGIKPANAYIDPSAVSMFFQAVVGTAIAGIGALALFWSNVKKMMNKIFKPGTQSKSNEIPAGTNDVDKQKIK